MINFGTIANNIFRKFGYEVKRSTTSRRFRKYPIDFNQDEVEIIEACKNFTMISPERMYDLIQSVKYVMKNNILGDIVECGVWKGGSIMIIAKTLLSHGLTNKEIFLYDTFTGMVEPSEEDFNILRNEEASKIFNERKNDDNSTNWNNISLEEVQNAVYKTG